MQRLYAVDLMALVSYDQVTHGDTNEWSLGYLTIVGMYVLKGNRYDVSTVVDLAVVIRSADHSCCAPRYGRARRQGNSGCGRRRATRGRAATGPAPRPTR